MHFILRGLATALLVLFLLSSGGCRRRQDVYLAGVETSEDTDEPAFAESENARADAAAAAGSDGTGVQADVPAEIEAASGENGTQTDGPAAAGSDAADAGADGSAAAGYVYVCGFVARPGVYEIYEGMRLFEAIELAGGFLPEADREWLNLAQPVSDGQRLYVCSSEETKEMTAAQRAGDVSGAETGGQGAQGADEKPSGTDSGKVNLNTADKDTLMTLPGIGEVKADAIIQYRTEYGAFKSAEDIMNIPGIKDAVYAKIEDRITV